MPEQAVVPAPTCDIVVFGGTGNLSMRKLLPALYHWHRDGMLTAESQAICLSRMS